MNEQVGVSSHPSASAATARQSHQVLLVVGGLDAAGNALNSVELFDPTVGWKPMNGLFYARANHTATLLPDGSAVILAGGVPTPNFVQATTVETYDTRNGNAYSVGRLAHPRSGHAAALVFGNFVMVTGGSGYEGGFLSSCELYNPQTFVWSQTGSLGVPRLMHTATRLKLENVLVVGGFGPGAEDSAELYTEATSSWMPSAPPKFSRVLHTATLLPDGTVLVVGGIDTQTGKGRTQCEIFDPATGSWREVSSLKGPRFSHTATYLDDGSGSVLVVGGASGTNQALNTAELYQPPPTDTWTPVHPMLFTRAGHTTTFYEGHAMVVGGGGYGTSEIYYLEGDHWEFNGTLNTPRGYHTTNLINEPPNPWAQFAGANRIRS
jgi:hypothetical protein